jgi:hypothetical protein
MVVVLDACSDSASGAWLTLRRVERDTGPFGRRVATRIPMAGFEFGHVLPDGLVHRLLAES